VNSLSSTCSCHHDVLPHHGPKVNGVKNFGLRPLKLWTKINFPLSCLCQVFCHIFEKS
jgi:hypothetical protein